MLGSIAIVIGIGVGMLCSKLFFQALSVLLKIDKTLPLVWNSKSSSYYSWRILYPIFNSIIV